MKCKCVIKIGQASGSGSPGSASEHDKEQIIVVDDEFLDKDLQEKDLEPSENSFKTEFQKVKDAQGRWYDFAECVKGQPIGSFAGSDQRMDDNSSRASSSSKSKHIKQNHKFKILN